MRSGSNPGFRARNAIAPSPGSSKPISRKKHGGKRFLEPYRLSVAERSAIRSRLREKGIGDEESRSLFAAALEYDLASCSGLIGPPSDSSSPAQPQPESEEKGALDDIAEAARSLADELTGLDRAISLRLQPALESTDRFRRSYSEDYIASLGGELRRVAGAGKVPNRMPTPLPGPAEDAHRFVLRAADAFEDCFELSPGPQADSAFVIALLAIVDATGIQIPTDEVTLNAILNPG